MCIYVCTIIASSLGYIPKSGVFCLFVLFFNIFIDYAIRVEF